MTENKDSNTPSEEDRGRREVSDFLNSTAGQWILRIAIVLAAFFLIQAVFF
ncbi:hypothetical protein GCM10009720_16110 [Yaniella flava]|uniref:Uncharacterized protein n=1 Tax=Yaniella flava TaxID=287930 RepID=A0ABP5FXS5_9MICC|nr:hypothetical protein [Micrococcaceae bacterium]